MSVDSEYLRLEGIPLPPRVATALYHIVKEALINVEKQAQACHVSILLGRDASRVGLTVEDDGPGFGGRYVPD